MQTTGELVESHSKQLSAEINGHALLAADLLLRHWGGDKNAVRLPSTMLYPMDTSRMYQLRQHLNIYWVEFEAFVTALDKPVHQGYESQTNSFPGSQKRIVQHLKYVSHCNVTKCCIK